MQQVADWLEKLGMSEYAQRFAENDIDASVLPHESVADSSRPRPASLLANPRLSFTDAVFTSRAMFRWLSDGPRLLAVVIALATLIGAWMFRFENVHEGKLHRNRIT
jgi:hypothetical protein